MTTESADVDLRRRALLPAGLRDVLPPDAQHEAEALEQLMGCLRQNGYQRVKPPLLEFEDSLFSGPGAAMVGQTFRAMDPVSQRMMGVRADMTVQAARLAATRLFAAPRPLRLCYAGEVLRVAADQLNPERELVQVGAELIGSDHLAADVEMIMLAVEALAAVGIEEVSVDISVPTLVPLVCDHFGLAAPAGGPLRDALDHKDASQVASLAGAAGPLLTELMLATGGADRCLATLAALELPATARALIERIGHVLAAVRTAKPDLAVTVDPVENRGFEYYIGTCFSLFRAGVRGELGRGGRYLVAGNQAEPAFGFTLYMETLRRALPPPTTRRRLLIAAGLSYADGAAWRAQGWATVKALDGEDDLRVEARRLGCSHALIDGAPVAVEQS